MLNHPARSTLAVLAAAVLLPLGAAQAATSSSTTTSSSTQTSAVAPTSTTSTTTTTESSAAATTLTTTNTSSTTSRLATSTATTTLSSSTSAGGRWKGRAHPSRPGRNDRVIPASAHAASDPTDTILDFKFAPASLTIHVGDTVTWVNNGNAPHTATASNGSFNTGTLNKGQSGSHTFTQAGTFAYICTIHPFMHGTVVVLANASSSSTPSSSGSSTTPSTSGTSTPTATTAATTSTGGLPNTGMNLLGAIGAGLLLAGGGIALRRRLLRS